jgi:hypothetical protein
LALRPHDIGAPADHPDRKSLISDRNGRLTKFTLPSRNLLRADYRRKANCPQSLHCFDPQGAMFAMMGHKH